MYKISDFTFIMHGVTKRSQRKAHSRNAAYSRWRKSNEEESIPCADPTMMVISNYENGSTYTKSRRILAAQGIDSPSKATYYRYQRKVNDSIIKLAKESMSEEANKMEHGTSISLDGAYAHRRNSSQCHGAFIDCKSHKIVAGSVVTKTRKNGDFEGSSNMMETEVIRRNLAQIDKQKVSRYVHDQDNLTGDLMSKSIQNIDEKIDPNHGKKCFLKFWNKLVEGSYRTIYKACDYAVSAVKYLTDIQYKKKFHGLKTHAQNWFNNLLYDKQMTNAEKKENWMNVELHVIGNHSRCNHSEKKTFVWKNGIQFPELQHDFHKFVDASSKVFDKIDANLHTNINESLHTETSKVADKNTAWSKNGYEGRVHYAYLKHNKPDECSMLIRQRNNIVITNIDQKVINETIDDRKKLREFRSTTAFKQSEANRRKKFKSSMKAKPGDYIGVPYTQLNE